MINVEVVFALPTTATCLSIEVPQGTTVEQAVIQSGIIQKCPEIDATSLTLGVWNRTVKANYELKDGDRIEIYRPLIADPKDARRKRAEKAKEEGRANKITGGRPLEKFLERLFGLTTSGAEENEVYELSIHRFASEIETLLRSAA